MSASQPSPVLQRKNRLQLLAILAIVLVPVLGSTFMYYTGIGLPRATSNNGLLVVPPIAVNDIALRREQDGSSWSWRAGGNFRLVVLVDGECDAKCQELLHNMRQVHVRLAKHASSVERWLIQLDKQQTPTILESQQGLEVLRGDFQSWRSLARKNTLIDDNFSGHQILLIDRRGNIVMIFDQTHSGQEMLDDVQFLIKSTQ